MRFNESRARVALSMALISLLAATALGQAQTRPPLRVAQQPAGSTPNAAGGAQNSAAPRAATPAATPPPVGDENAQWRQAPQIVPARGPRAPFKLTPEEEQSLNEALKKWEEKGDKIVAFKCNFHRWEFDTAFGDPQQRWLRTEGNGALRYWAPDHGKYLISSLDTWSAGKPGQPFTKTPLPSTDLEHWVCDGESIFQVDAHEKHLIQHKLPPEMRGKAITDGPLPFVFGTKAEQVKRRYFVRLVTPPEQKGKQIWIEAWPKFQVDAANYQRVTIALTDPDYVPYALQVFQPGSPLPGAKMPNGEPAADKDCNRTVYLFENPVVNGKFEWLNPSYWLPPIVPPTWTKIVQEPDGGIEGAGTAESLPPAGAKTQPPGPQATRGQGPPLRR